MATTYQTTTHEHTKPHDPCPGGKSKACGTNEVVRARYFYSMLLEPSDLNVDQTFHLENQRRHNAELHGFGTVCGLKVRDTRCDWQIVIEPGVAIDCLGRVIRVTEAVELDLRDLAQASFRRAVHEEREQLGETGDPSRRPDPGDRECWPRETDLWVMLCYYERPERPVQAIGGPESCCESTCQNSRIRHGFCVYVTDKKPDKPKCLLDAIDCHHGSLRERVCQWIVEGCCGCKPDPCGDEDHYCLALAKVTVRKDGEVLKPDNCSYRSLVLPTALISELLLTVGEE